MIASDFRHWTDAEDLLLAAAWSDGEPVDRLATELSRTVFAVRNRAKALALKRPSQWTPVQLAVITAEFGKPGHSTRDIARRIGKSVGAVKQKARKLGLVSYRWWTREEMAVLKARYGKEDAGLIARDLGRTRGQVHRQAAKHRLHRFPRLPQKQIDRVKRLHAQGLPDRVIAERTGLSYDWAKHIRSTYAAPTGHPDVESKRRAIDNQRKTLGVKSSGELRAYSYRQYAIANGWPEDCRPREVQILNVLATSGLPMSAAELAAAIGSNTSTTHRTGSRRLLLCSNGPGGTYTADLAQRGLVTILQRAAVVHGQGRGKSKHLYTLGPIALAILQERASEQQNPERQAGVPNDAPAQRSEGSDTGCRRGRRGEEVAGDDAVRPDRGRRRRAAR